jgi:hypothetical protein
MDSNSVESNYNLLLAGSSLFKVPTGYLLVVIRKSILSYHNCKLANRIESSQTYLDLYQIKFYLVRLDSIEALRIVPREIGMYVFLVESGALWGRLFHHIHNLRPVQCVRKSRTVVVGAIVMNVWKGVCWRVVNSLPAAPLVLELIGWRESSHTYIAT